jgi:lipoate---protein ligase
MNRQVSVLTSHDPYRNLATEEHLLDDLSGDEEMLVLYVNRPVVVIGKHQNPWIEVNLPELDRRGISLARRISGGGTVFHDLGNLNFSFLGPKKDFDRRGNLSFVCEVLAGFGVAASVSEKFDLYADDRKISGNAFCYRRSSVLHHGTLLVDADLAALGGLLAPPELAVKTHAVRSRPARITNLSSLDPSVTISRLIEAFAGEFADNAEPVHLDQQDHIHESISALQQRNCTWDWLFGRTPDFWLESVLSTGESAGVRVRKGRIVEITGPPWSDGLALEIDQLALCRADIEMAIQEMSQDGQARELMSILSRVAI